MIFFLVPIINLNLFLQIKLSMWPVLFGFKNIIIRIKDMEVLLGDKFSKCIFNKSILHEGSK